MNFKRHLCIFTLSAISYTVGALAQTQDSIRQSIVDHIKEGGRHELVMTDSIAKLLLPSTEVSNSKKNKALRTFWRVQVFSDSKGERSRQEGLRRRSAVARKFTEYPIELKWDSPYWQLRVGKFKTREEAEEAANDIKKAFPGYSSEIHIVRQRMKVDDE